MPDTTLQSLLDPASDSTGVTILKRVDNGNGITSYYCSGGETYPGKQRWIDVNTADTDANKAAAINAALGA